MSISPTTAVAPMPSVHRAKARVGIAVFLSAVMVSLLPAVLAGAAQAPIGLGVANSFAVLAGSGISNTGPTTISGDVGSFPTTSQTGFGSVTLTGTNHGGDAVTQQAKNDLVTAYNQAFAATPATAIATELGGLTLTPGVYSSNTFGITGTLTLDTQGDPDAVFVFKAQSTLITAASSQVVVLGGAVACNVYWQVGSSATLATNSTFVGTVLASTSVTANTGATITGRLLALGGAVTLDTNSVTRPACAAASASPTATTAATSSPSSASSSGRARRGGGGTTGLANTGSDPWLPIAGVLLLVTGALLIRSSRDTRRWNHRI